MVIDLLTAMGWQPDTSVPGWWRSPDGSYAHSVARTGLEFVEQYLIGWALSLGWTVEQRYACDHRAGLIVFGARVEGSRGQRRARVASRQWRNSEPPGSVEAIVAALWEMARDTGLLQRQG